MCEVEMCSYEDMAVLGTLSRSGKGVFIVERGK